MIKRILAPVDFSEPSLRALDHAVELGRTFRAELLILHVVEPVYYPVAHDLYGVGFDVGNIYDEIQRAARGQLDRLAAKLRVRRVRLRTLLALGTAHQVIVDQARKHKVDLLVLSTHGRSGLSRVLMGSVAERVVRTAPCPVLTAPGRASRHSASPARRRSAGPARRRR